MQNRRGYTILSCALFTLAVSSLGLAVYTYQLDSLSRWKSSSGNDPMIGDLKTEVTSFNTIIGLLDTQINQLHHVNATSGVSQLQSSLFEARLAASTNVGRASQLILERQRFTSMLGNSASTGANLVGMFFYVGGGKDYSIIDGIFANTGESTAHSAKLILTFYSGQNGQGSALCALSYLLGDIAGQSLTMASRISCGSGTISVGSVTFQFSWT
ncbi:MAG TPA: hypothetical protein VE177_03795 [Candidatus Binatus sp.]|nr:hypothetical protein [Candidatus Binatus sp.]